MKMNLWQWLAILLLIVGIGYVVYEKNFKTPAAPTTRSTQHR